MIRSIYSFIVVTLLVTICSSVGLASTAPDSVQVTLNNGNDTTVTVTQETVNNLYAVGEKSAGENILLQMLITECQQTIDSSTANTDKLEKFVESIGRDVDILEAVDELLSDMNTDANYRSPDPKWKLAKEAWEALDDGRYKEADRQYTLLMKHYGEDLRSLNNRGQARYECHDFDLALADWTEANRIDSCYLPALKNLWAYYRNQECYYKAIPFLKQAIDCGIADQDIRRKYLVTIAKTGNHDWLWEELRDQKNLDALHHTDDQQVPSDSSEKCQ